VRDLENQLERPRRDVEDELARVNRSVNALRSDVTDLYAA